MSKVLSKPMPKPVHGAIGFKSGGQGLRCTCLSNLFACHVPWKLNGNVEIFPSTEHVYVFLCLVDEGQKPHVKDWTVGGKYADYANIAEMGGNSEYWRKKEMIGVTAKMRGNRMRRKDKKVGRKSAERVWLPILRAKFASNPTLLQVLHDTGDASLLEVSNRLHTKPIADWKKFKWEGHVHKVTGKRYGFNWMGDLLMKLRAELCGVEYVPWVPTATRPALPQSAAAKKEKAANKARISADATAATKKTRHTKQKDESVDKGTIGEGKTAKVGAQAATGTRKMRAGTRKTKAGTMSAKKRKIKAVDEGATGEGKTPKIKEKKIKVKEKE